jgi:hypothetical protein
MIEVALTVLVVVVVVVVAGVSAALAMRVAARLARIERRLRMIERDRRLENDRRIRELVKAIQPLPDTDFRNASPPSASNSASNVRAIRPRSGRHGFR